METKNAKIVSAFLGYEDYGIFTFSLSLDYGGTRQGFGQYELEYPAYGVKMIEKILKTVGVDSWEQLPGKHIRVVAEHTKVHKIGNLIEDKWFSPEDLITELLQK